MIHLDCVRAGGEAFQGNLSILAQEMHICIVFQPMYGNSLFKALRHLLLKSENILWLCVCILKEPAFAEVGGWLHCTPLESDYVGNPLSSGSKLHAFTKLAGANPSHHVYGCGIMPSAPYRRGA